MWPHFIKSSKTLSSTGRWPRGSVIQVWVGKRHLAKPQPRLVCQRLLIDASKPCADRKRGYCGSGMLEATTDCCRLPLSEGVASH
eukprot:5141235-Pyramimonas_sp.AAC.2